ETEQLLEEKETIISLKEEHQKEDGLEKKDNDEEQQAEAETQLLLKRDGSAHATLRYDKTMEIEDLKCLLKTRETESKKEIEMLQEKISLLSIQLLDEEKETEGLTEDIKCKNDELHVSIVYMSFNALVLKQQTQQQEQKIERQMQEGREREQDLQRQLQERERQLEEREREFQERERQLEEQIQVAESSWVVNRREITMTEVVLGKGGWGEVKVAGFRGLKVAAKCLYEVIISPYNIGTFSREMNIASKIRHPNLLQFIGATTEGNPMILTELMPTSLRKELESGGVAYPAILSISLDVACALNYLHLFKPHPILHRDVSSANVLLQTTGETWRAKVSYYGSANLQPLISRTTNPGNPLYAAPEAGNPREHSPAMDVFSYGVLLLEMITRRIPLPEERVGLIDSIRRASFRSLVERCLIVEYRHRPTMNDIITELNDTVY
uniref:Protein kinase domain-containing protein n=1 Tax=Amphimedon queenslandica TaxID=400682 RepID=A0A1X7STZ6_AMPQE